MNIAERDGARDELDEDAVASDLDHAASCWAILGSISSLWCAFRTYRSTRRCATCIVEGCRQCALPAPQGALTRWRGARPTSLGSPVDRLTARIFRAPASSDAYEVQRAHRPRPVEFVLQFVFVREVIEA
jgi:hypothetical protein